RMAAAFAQADFAGCSISECIDFDHAPGGEWLVGLRWTDEFGPVITVGAGGVSTEFLAAALAEGRDLAAFAPDRLQRDVTERRLKRLAWTPLLTGGVRKQPARASLDELFAVVERFAALAPLCSPDGITELEVNPLVPHDGRLIALDVLAHLGNRRLPVVPPRPIEKLQQLLRPTSIAVVGVSERMNPGRIILHNLIREGFDRASVFVVKPGVTEIDGCVAVPSVSALPHRVDLVILAIAAQQMPQVLTEIIDGRKAESVIVIPGGLEEKEGSADIVEKMHATLQASRATDWHGPVINGGNCLGILSRPGHYDTMFIPPHKLGTTPGPASPVAIVSQSGAFAASRASRFGGVRPMYSITVGNQMDLTVGDYLQHLEKDPLVKVFGVYVEGFRPMDGRATLEAIERITSTGRTVVLYRAGRTPAGAKATASHTASMAGDYVVTRELARAAGAVIADTLDDFTDLVSLFTLLGDRPVHGRRVGAVSNAGYECVAFGDHLRTLELPTLTPSTEARLKVLLDNSHVSGIMDVHNPLDLTPMLDDAGYAAAARYVLADDHVDVGVIACVPVTSALSTLAPDPSHTEDVCGYDAIGSRLVRLNEETTKPWVAVIDAGPLYDPLARRLSTGGIPTFRSSDRAMRLLSVFVEKRMASARRDATVWIDEFSMPQA
ncbi:MAG: acetate--CoA ligase family protein, partial [Acidobacteria bacterium]|nr:acetate--CoA ligase family protein [Acidobacteriota bacterium]